jgi:hypothetical protein
MDYVLYGGMVGLLLLAGMFLWALGETLLEMRRYRREAAGAERNVEGVDLSGSIKS